MTALLDAARAVVLTADPTGKANAARACVAAWRAGALTLEPVSEPWPDRPGRPEKPLLLSPTAMPRRTAGGVRGRIALLHAVAHIELNAIDLAFDMVGRFLHAPEIAANPAFADDWLGVGDDEARHFLLLSTRLAALGAAYGDLPAHDGLWETATKTADDVGARLAIAPLVHEARGLDVTPPMIAKLRRGGDDASAAALEVIHREEVGHVAAGVRWFARVCAARGQDTTVTFRHYVRETYRGSLKPPFNLEARAEAGFPVSFLPSDGIPHA